MSSEARSLLDFVDSFRHGPAAREDRRRLRETMPIYYICGEAKKWGERCARPSHLVGQQLILLRITELIQSYFQDGGRRVGQAAAGAGDGNGEGAFRRALGHGQVDGYLRRLTAGRQGYGIRHQAAFRSRRPAAARQRDRALESAGG